MWPSKGGQRAIKIWEYDMPLSFCKSNSLFSVPFFLSMLSNQKAQKTQLFSQFTDQKTFFVRTRKKLMKNFINVHLYRPKFYHNPTKPKTFKPNINQNPTRNTNSSLELAKTTSNQPNRNQHFVNLKPPITLDLTKLHTYINN